MKVLFLEDVENVAVAGQVKEVAPGYARNYLLPRKLAVAATPGNLKAREQHLQALQRRQAQAQTEARSLAQRLDGASVTVQARVGAGDRLYGSVTASDIATALEQLCGAPVDRRKIELAEPLKSLGTHPVTVRLSKEAVAQVQVVVEGVKA